MSFIKKIFNKLSSHKIKNQIKYTNIKKDIDYIFEKTESLISECETVIKSDYFFETKESLKNYLNQNPDKTSSLKRKVLHLNQTIIDIFEKYDSLEKMYEDFNKLYLDNKKINKLKEYKKLIETKEKLVQKISLLKRYKRISNIVFRKE